MMTLIFDEEKMFEFTQKLIERRQELIYLEEIGSDATKAVELDQSRVGRLSRMDALQGQAMSQELRRRHEQELMRISAALVRIDKKEYGYCVRCDESISIGRLEYDPAVSHCIECAGILE